jgi:hypothetical protein
MYTGSAEQMSGAQVENLYYEYNVIDSIPIKYVNI